MEKISTLPGCYQSIKDKNFESNSQLNSPDVKPSLSCYQSIKDKNFESNSQRRGELIAVFWAVISLSKIKISKAIHNIEKYKKRRAGRCYQSIKDKNFESNSQLLWDRGRSWSRCYQSIKDKNFESNSQPSGCRYLRAVAVISLSKIKISKAIHNVRN